MVRIGFDVCFLSAPKGYCYNKASTSDKPPLWNPNNTKIVAEKFKDYIAKGKAPKKLLSFNLAILSHIGLFKGFQLKLRF